MPKSNGRSLFNRSSRSGTVTVIEAPVSATFRRRARITFFVVAGITGLLAATIASHMMQPVAGLMLGVLIGVAVALPIAALVLAWPVIRVFGWWSGEIVAALALIYGWQWLIATTALWGSLLVVAVIAGLPAVIGPMRRRIVAFGWCAIVRHRLRVAFNAFIVSNRQGSLPLILASRPTPAGERVWVWLRPGLSLADLEGRIDKLAVTCWANEVRVLRASQTYAALIRVDITRRNPLAEPVGSPLPDMVPDFTAASVAPTSPGMPPIALGLPDFPDSCDGNAAAVSALRGRRSRPTLTKSTESNDDLPYGANNADWA